jgi:hypothetical protein
MADQLKPESDERTMGNSNEEVRGKAIEEEEFEDSEDLDDEEAEDEEGNF